MANAKTTFRILPVLLDGFRQLSEIDESLFDTILKEISTSAIGTGPNSLADHLISRLGNPELEIRPLVDVIYSFVPLQLDNKEGSFGELSKQLIASLIEFDMEVPDSFESRLIRVFEASETIRTTAKALRLKSESKNIYVRGRVISDVRLVFDDSQPDISKNYSGMVVHALRIVYETYKGKDEIFVSLDGSDLRELQQIINRAVEKDDYLNSIIENKGIDPIKFTE